MKKQVLIFVCTLLCVGAIAQSQNNEVFIDQVGESHSVTVLQAVGGLAKFNKADINQSGIEHFANINQGVDGANATANHTTVEQRGEASSAFVDQGEGLGSTAKDNRARIEQQGTNSAAIRQGNVGEAYTNWASILQEGENEATINQGAGLNGIARNNQAYTTQYGYGNDITVDQGTLGGIATNNQVKSEQTGSGNQGLIQQAGTAGSITKDSEVSLMQTGEENEAFLFQEGANDYINVVQQGNGNSAIVSQGAGLPF